MLTSEMCLLRVLLLWALLCPGKGNGVQEEIFTRPGSDLLIPIRIHLTLNHTDISMCNEIEWKYNVPTRTNEKRIFIHRKCRYNVDSEDILFPNMRISENGSLIISNVTLENDGIYSVEIYNSALHRIQTDVYTVHVEVPVSDPVLDVRCLQNGSVEISCGVKSGTDPSIYLTVNGKLEVYNVTSSKQTIRVTKSPASPPDSWNINCSAKNDISERSTNWNHDACPAETCPTCLRNSLIGGFLALLVTMPPIFIAHWYILHGMRRNLRSSPRKTQRNTPSSIMRQQRRTSP